jgi:hypothetical protein
VYHKLRTLKKYSPKAGFNEYTTNLETSKKIHHGEVYTK